MQTVKELESTIAVKNSMKSVPAALDYLALVVVQDALEDAERYPENPVHALLLGSPLFRCFFAVQGTEIRTALCQESKKLEAMWP
jgi:hypothetical protein